MYEWDADATGEGGEGEDEEDAQAEDQPEPCGGWRAHCGGQSSGAPALNRVATNFVVMVIIRWRNRVRGKNRRFMLLVQSYPTFVLRTPSRPFAHNRTLQTKLTLSSSWPLMVLIEHF